MSDTLDQNTPLMRAIAAKTVLYMGDEEDSHVLISLENLKSKQLKPEEIPLIRAFFDLDEKNSLTCSSMAEYIMAYTLPKRFTLKTEIPPTQRQLLTLSECAAMYGTFAEAYGQTIHNTWVEDLFWTLHENDSAITRENKVRLGIFLAADAYEAGDFSRGLKVLRAYTKHLVGCQKDLVEKATQAYDNFFNTMVFHGYELPGQVDPLYKELKETLYSGDLNLAPTKLILSGLIMECQRRQLHERFEKPDPREGTPEVAIMRKPEDTVFEERFIELLEHDNNRYLTLLRISTAFSVKKLAMPAVIRDLHDGVIRKAHTRTGKRLGKFRKNKTPTVSAPVFRKILAQVEEKHRQPRPEVARPKREVETPSI